MLLYLANKLEPVVARTIKCSHYDLTTMVSDRTPLLRQLHCYDYDTRALYNTLLQLEAI